MADPMLSNYPGGPFDAVPDAPEACVTCGSEFVGDTATGEVRTHEDDGHTCSVPCHEAWVKQKAQDRAADLAATEAMYQHWLESEQLTGGRAT